MSEENIEKLQEQIKTELATLNKEVTEVSKEVKEESKDVKGYMDRDTYIKKHGSDEGFKDKDQFDRDGSFFKKIEAQNKKIDELLEFNRQSIEHGRKVEKAAYEKALRDLQMEKIELIRNADAEGVLALEQRTEVVREQIREIEKPVVPVQTPSTMDSESIAFKERNAAWINGTNEEDKKMQAMSRAVITYLQETEPNISSHDAIIRIESELKEKFPGRFESQYKDKPSLVGHSTAGKESDRKAVLINKLTKQQKDFVKKARDYGSKLTEEEYAKQLVLTGDLRDE